jgi:ATP phosphoribosyltransferase
VTSHRARLAIPNKGRLLEPTLTLLQDAGLVFDAASRSLVSQCENFPLDLLFVRTEDVVEFVSDGVADAGITGTNLLVESGRGVEVLVPLAYGRCRLEAAVPADSRPQALDDLAGLRLATSHPRATAGFFAERNLAVEVVPISGAVEVAPHMGLADGIVDLVATGSTLLMNGLRSVGVLLDSEAVLVAPHDGDRRHPDEIQHVETMLRAVVAGRRRKYVMMNAPLDALPAIERILPGLASPSILPLAQAGMAAVHAVVGDGEVWGLLGDLKRAGASGILVLPIEMLVP